MVGLESALRLSPIARWDVSSEMIFRALDSHEFEVDGNACFVEVLGVYDDADQRWVQLALDGHGHQMVTLRLHAKVDLDWALVSRATDLSSLVA